MEDIIAVLDGRPGIEEEVASALPPIRAFLAEEFFAGQLLASSDLRRVA